MKNHKSCCSIKYHEITIYFVLGTTSQEVGLLLCTGDNFPGGGAVTYFVLGTTSQEVGLLLTLCWGQLPRRWGFYLLCVGDNFPGRGAVEL
jgi:hypothetical protein